jgi:hypothetical protein
MGIIVGNKVFSFQFIVLGKNTGINGTGALEKHISNNNFKRIIKN